MFKVSQSAIIAILLAVIFLWAISSGRSIGHLQNRVGVRYWFIDPSIREIRQRKNGDLISFVSLVGAQQKLMGDGAVLGTKVKANRLIVLPYSKLESLLSEIKVAPGIVPKVRFDGLVGKEGWQLQPELLSPSSNISKELREDYFKQSLVFVGDSSVNLKFRNRNYEIVLGAFYLEDDLVYESLPEYRWQRLLLYPVALIVDVVTLPIQLLNKLGN